MKTKSSISFSKLNSIASDIIEQIGDKIIYTEEDGSYCVFNKYKLSYRPYQTIVSYINGHEIHRFYNIKNAISWCIYDHRSRFYDSRRIIDLDRQLASVDVDIVIHRRLYSSKKNSEREIYELKLNEDMVKKISIIKMLQNYINTSKEWHINRLNAKT